MHSRVDYGVAMLGVRDDGLKTVAIGAGLVDGEPSGVYALYDGVADADLAVADGLTVESHGSWSLVSPACQVLGTWDATTSSVVVQPVPASESLL